MSSAGSRLTAYRKKDGCSSLDSYLCAVRLDSAAFCELNSFQGPLNRRVIKKDQRITLENGTTLAGSAITMLDAFRNLIKIGLSLEEAVEMTSVRQAEYLGLQDLGRIEPGARACLVKLDDALQLQGVWVYGELVPPSRPS